MKKLYLFILPIILICSLTLKIFAAHLGYPFFWIWDEWGEVHAALQMIVNQTIDPNYYLHGPFPTYFYSLIDIFHIFSLVKSNIIDINLSDLFFKIPSETANLPNINLTKEFFEIKYSSFLLWNRYVVAIFGTIGCFVVYEIAKRSFNEKTAIVSLLIYSFCPFISFTLANLQPEGMMVSFFLISMYFAILYSEKKSLA
jgi:Dolichyl-phosphate-mannose-protein mannosyltransferase